MSIRLVESLKKGVTANKGLSLIELIIVSVLLVVVLSVGYLLFSFGYDSFFIAQGRSDVQQNVRIASDYITREIRNARTMTLLSDVSSIPAVTNIPAGDHYIFVNADGKLEHRTEGVSEFVPEGISQRVSFDVGFSVSVSNNRIMAYQITGTRDNGQTNTLISEVFLENLAFQGSTIAVSGSDPVGVYFKKDAAAQVIALTANPYRVEENPYLAKNYTFELNLVNETFDSQVDDGHIIIADDFASMNIVSLSRNSDTTATLVINGVLAINSGVGTIKVIGTGLTNGNDLETKVLLLVPVGYLTARPSEVNENSSEFATYTFILEIAEGTNEFKRDLLKSDVHLSGDFLTSGLTITSITRLSNALLGYTPDRFAEIVLSGPLTMNDTDGSGFGVAYIIVGTDIEGDVYNSGYALTAPVIVRPAGYIPTYTLSVSIRGIGNTNPSPGEHQATQDEEVDLEAFEIEASDWLFYRWTVNNVAQTDGDADIVITMNGNKAAVAHFRLPFIDIPNGSHVLYNNQQYIKLSNTRLMNLYQSANTMSWSANPAWPTKSELEALSSAQRGGAGNYWTGTEESNNWAYYVDNNGNILTRRKNEYINQRPCITINPTNLYAYSGDGSTHNTALDVK